MFINVKECKKFTHDYNKQLSKEAIEALNFKVQNILLSAIRNARGFTRIHPTEINYAKEN